MKKILTSFLYLIIVFVVLFNIFSHFNVPFLGFRMFKVGSGSMYPYLKVNDIIVVKSRKNYKVNDVVTYIDGKSYITHRIISIDGDEIITKGDANNTEDKPIIQKKIIGKVIYKFKILGYVLSLKFSLFWIFVVGFIITILIPDKNKRKK